MKKWRRVFMWVVLNGAMCYVLYSATVLENERAENVVKFVIWVFFIIALLLQFVEDEVKIEIRKTGASVPNGVNLTYSAIYACCLAAYGWFGYATLEILTAILLLGIYNKEK